MTTFSIDTYALTVIATDAAGEPYDLNACGEPCRTAGDLVDFVHELHTQGAYGVATRDTLIEAC